MRYTGRSITFSKLSLSVLFVSALELACWKVKGKVFLTHALMYWGSGSVFPLILTSALIWGEWTLSLPGRFVPRKERRYLWIRGWAGLRTVWTFRRRDMCLAPAGITLWTSCVSLDILSQELYWSICRQVGGLIKPDSKLIFLVLTHLVCCLNICRQFSVLCSTEGTCLLQSDSSPSTETNTYTLC